MVAISPGRIKFYLTAALAGEAVAFCEVHSQRWQVQFMDYDLGLFDEQARVFHPTVLGGPPVE